MLIAVVACAHFEAPPDAGDSFIDPDLSSTINRSGGRPRRNGKVSTPQLSASWGGPAPPIPPVPVAPPPPTAAPAGPQPATNAIKSEVEGIESSEWRILTSHGRT